MGGKEAVGVAASFFGRRIQEMERLSGRPEGMVCCGKQLKCGFSEVEIHALRRLARELAFVSVLVVVRR